MRGKYAELRWQSAEPLRSVSWHHEGKHFISSHTDGSLCTWPLRPTLKPQFHSFPHGNYFIFFPPYLLKQSFILFFFFFNLAKMTKDGKLEVCKPIHKVELKTTKTGYV